MGGGPHPLWKITRLFFLMNPSLRGTNIYSQVINFYVLLRCVDDINQGLDEINESRGPQDAVLHAVQARDPGARVSRQQQLQQARGEVGERGRCIKSIMVGLINF